MKLSLRGWFVVGACAAVLAAVAATAAPLLKAADAPAAVPGRLSHEQLGQMLQAMGLKVSQQQQRYDFSFRATYGEDEWDLTMSAVLSQNGESVWVMAWLDELPQSSVEVPKIALLRLLANNDRLGKGQFFAFVASNRRFVLQRVVDNQNLTSAGLRQTLQELGGAVAQTHAYWAVANWKETSEASAAAPATAAPTAAQPTPIAQPQRVPAAATTQSVLRDSKYSTSARQ